MSEAFATFTDVEARGLVIPAEQQGVADQLCEDASDIIRSRWDDVDARIASGALRAESVTRVVATMVKRAMERAAPEGVQTASQASGPFSLSQTYLAAASERLYLTGEDKRLFDGKSGERRAFAVDMAQPCSPYDGWRTW